MSLQTRENELWEWRKKGKVDKLIHALKGNDINLQCTAVTVLSYFTDQPKVIQALLESLDQGSLELKEKIISLFSSVPDPLIIPALQKMEKQPQLRVKSIKALQDLARNIISQSGIYPENIRYMEQIGPQAVPVLAEFFQKQEFRDSILPVLISMKNVVINWFAAEVKNGRAYKTPNLINMMEALNWHPQSTEEQVFACLAKKQYSECIAFGTQAVEPMLTALSIAEKDDVPSIVRTLCALGDPRAIDVIGDALLGKDTDLRLNALESLERIQNSRAVPWLIKALMKYPDELQEKIASALNRLVPLNWSRDMLAPLLDSYKPELTVFILEILGRTGDTRALPVLKEKLANPLPQIRLACSKALALCGEPQWENIIRGEKEDFERLIIAGNTDALTILIRRLEDYDFEIRKSAAQAFQRIVKSGPEMLRREWGKIHKLITEPRKAETIVNLMSFDSSDSSTRDTGIGMEFPAAFPE